MQIVIDIPEEFYKNTKKYNRLYWEWFSSKSLTRAIKKGVVLPNNHGRLIDESDLIPDSDYEDGMFYAVSIGAINGAPTIIEADKEESEG